MSPITYYEFFAGGGMARLGIEAAIPGATCLFASDKDVKRASTYALNFGDQVNTAPVRDLTTADLPSVPDLVWASPPCQDVSLAGARAGLSGSRSSAFWGFWRLMEGLAREGRAPSAIVIENVVGLMTSNGGRDFEAIRSSMRAAGYHVEAAVVDAADFLPQSRPRLFIVGSHRPPPARPPTPGRTQRLADVLEPDDQVTWHDSETSDKLLRAMSLVNAEKVLTAMQSKQRVVGAGYRRGRGGVCKFEVRFDGLAGCLRTPGGGSSRQVVLVTERASGPAPD